MDIIIDHHTLERSEERGASIVEIEETIRSGKIEDAKEDRKAKSKVFDFNNEHKGKWT